MSDQVVDFPQAEAPPVSPAPVGPTWSYGPDGIEFEDDFPGNRFTPPVHFRFKPLDQETMIRQSDRQPLKDGAKPESPASEKWRSMRETLRTRMLAWDLKKKDGTVIDFKSDNELKNVPPGIIMFIAGRIADAGGFVDDAVGKL